jgi:ParB-like chromosome segregation protein Spo0J
MSYKIVKISEVKPNPRNPRIIKDAKFKKLVQSIMDFPQMLKIRPIVVNENMEALAGNMRLKACIEAGLIEVPIIDASYLTPEQQKEFVIKDNVGFGDWDWDELANEWEALDLKEWGMDIPFEEPEIEIEAEPINEPTMKITFKSPEDLQKAENEIQEILDREFDGAYLSINL